MSTASRATLVDELVIANHVLHAQGIVDGFGHVSVRDTDEPGRFLLARSMAPALVTAQDILILDPDGEVIDGAGRQSYLERFIHSAIYRARPDVGAIVHSHSVSMIPFGVTRRPLRPIYHMCGFLGAGCALFEIREGAGETDLLIRNAALGVQLATALGNASVVLMRGHGSTVVGSSVRQAVFRAVYAETKAKLQAQSEAMGEVSYLSAKESELASAAVDTQIDRAWTLWRDALAK